jgi:hypothetical protein
MHLQWIAPTAPDIVAARDRSPIPDIEEKLMKIVAREWWDGLAHPIANE